VINRSAAEGFGRGAAIYDASRPSYPEAVIDLVEGDVVLDLAAGTGKLTRLLARAGRFVLGVEPVDAMRSHLASHAPAAGGVAEAIPLRDACVDAVTVAQAFHWFSYERAFVEIRRVLRPGGLLLLVWNQRDDAVPWVAAMSDVIHAHDPGDAYEKRDDWADLAAAVGGFTPVEHLQVPHPHPATAELVVDRALSTSYVSAASEEVRAQVARDVRSIVAGFDEPFDLPYVTDVYTCRKR